LVSTRVVTTTRKDEWTTDEDSAQSVKK
jgi:hypothetical protein